MAATRALAALAKEDVPDSVLTAYGVRPLEVRPEYIIPKPFDPRVLFWEASAVAERRDGDRRGAVERSTWTSTATSWNDCLGKRPRSHALSCSRPRLHPKRIVFPEGEHEKIIRASYQLLEEEMAYPILIGRPAIIHSKWTNWAFMA